jgi:hypothetical protein
MPSDRMTNAAVCTTNDPLLLFGVKATYGETKCQPEKFIPLYYFFRASKTEKQNRDKYLILLD